MSSAAEFRGLSAPTPDATSLHPTRRQSADDPSNKSVVLMLYQAGRFSDSKMLGSVGPPLIGIVSASSFVNM